VEVLARGPVHEAFAQVPELKVEAPPAVPKPPPKPIEELPPAQKPDDPNVEWIPGYWAWDNEANDYVWVSGTWRVPPPGREWVSGHWQQVTGGWQWVPGFWASLDKNELQILPAPPAPVEEGPSAPAPDATSTYVPGTWVFEQGRYLWRPGFWVPNQENWVWNPAHYLWAPGGAIFVDGYWDYPLANRGLLFAPVQVNQAVLGRPNWTFVPQYVVNAANLLDALFVRPGTAHYYFGDYFGPRYEKAGFVPWVSARFGRNVPNPLFSYYLHRPDGARWERDVRGLYTARARGEGVPPRTLAQQNRVIEGFRGKTVDRAALNRMTVVHPLSQVQSQAFKLREIPRDQTAALKHSIDWHRQVQAQRGTYGTQVLSRGAAAAERRYPPW
jgi:hypothetical protein